jgi:hypothetical protein
MENGNDVHIVLGAGDPVLARAAWETEQLRRLADAQRRHLRDLEARDGYEEQQQRVREACAARYMSLIEWLEPYVDGTMGEATAGMAAVYSRTVASLAALYGGGRPLRAPTPPPVWPEPEKPDAGSVEAVRVAATVAARAAVSEQLGAVKRKMLAAGLPEAGEE